MIIDLQLHSTYSDGYLSPTELADFIASQGVKVASLTDHNTTHGQAEFQIACRKNKIKTISGMEIYARLNNYKFNLLWYNFNLNDAELHEMLARTQLFRKENVRQHLHFLEKRGFKINIEKILDRHHHYTPINHIITEIKSIPSNLRKIQSELNLKNIREEQIIKEYFYNPKMPRMMHDSRISLPRIVKLKNRIGGQLILNHPGKRNQLKKDFLLKLKDAGIDGLEVISPHHSLSAVMQAQALARELDWIASGGSDFHRFEGGHELIQSAFNYLRIESESLRLIRKIIG